MIIENKAIATNVYKMVITDNDIVKSADIGKFINIYTKNPATLLPRPISISEISDTSLTIVYQVVGTGTAEFAKYKVGDMIKVSPAIGNGFKIANVNTHILVGGGIGVAPLVELAKRIEGKKIAILGFRDEPFLVDRLEELGVEVHVATDTGQAGFKGNAVQLIKSEKIEGDYYYACGPKPMLKALSEHCKQINKPVQISMEERMGCGYGVCVGCVCKVNGYNKKVCTDGPVFLGNEVNWE
ncbi:MAG: oxidoreductase [Epulopiscium sp. Nuni2H_MBin003]|nr:MAG: oxidoreductase [Epulopiscium sp. Nuni2H_MBin003]